MYPVNKCEQVPLIPTLTLKSSRLEWLLNAF
jgi:hypothetical protein